MATHTSILVWRISWTEEPGGSIRVTDRTNTTEHAQARTPKEFNSISFPSSQYHVQSSVSPSSVSGAGGVTRKMDDLHPLVDGQMKKGGKCLSVACIQR